jgi:putative transposase
MALPRSKYVEEGSVGVYHCFCRCVRRAFLCGSDPVSGRNFSHRKTWIVDRLRLLASIFAIDVFSYSVVENHYHTVLRTRPDIARAWSSLEVARRWLTLCPNRYRSKKKPPPPIDLQIQTLADRPERIAELRIRLASLSWFMKHCNEFIARAANKEDDVKGRFWESRFKCQALLDDSAIASCMAYVDLNPIRAGKATTPENSDFTSIQHRIHTWQNRHASPEPQNWLCPIQSPSGCFASLQMTEEEYFELVDGSGRAVRSGKGAIDPDLEPILQRLRVRKHNWADTVSRFGDKFHLAAGLPHNLRSFARHWGKCWFKGITVSRSVFMQGRPSSS